MDRDVLAGLTAAHREIEATLGQALTAQAAASVPVTGTDDTGSVSVVVAADGTIVEFYLEPEWRQSIDVDGLGDAVAAATVVAAAARLETWAEAFTDDEATVGDATPITLPRPTGGTTAELAALLREINRDIDRLSNELQSTLAARHTGRSRPGHATATVTGARTFVEVRYDLRWLVNADAHNIVRETTDALRAAYELAGRRTIADVIAASPLGSLVGDQITRLTDPRPPEETT